MKKLLSIIIAGLLFVNTSYIYAENPKTVNITITIAHTLDIDVGGSADLKLSPGQTDVSKTSIWVKNIGTGVPENIKLINVTEPPAGYVLQFQFTETDDSTTLKEEDWQNPADISIAIPYNAARYLWIKLGVPKPTDLTELKIFATIKAE